MRRSKRLSFNFTLRAVKAIRPDYLAIGIESNVLLSHSPAKWQQLKELHRETYSAIKARYPDLPVFFTTEVLHYTKLATEAKDKDQEGEVADLMKQSDMFALSIYPHMSYSVPRPIPSGMFDFARAFAKPIAVAESGMTLRRGTEGFQAHAEGIRSGSKTIHRAVTEIGCARPLRICHQLRHNRLREVVRKTASTRG